ncbi:cell division protein FtsL [Bacillus sp. MUM 116]|uniref:cell division protein FtsL n=1 Tax=Bacillus sp. MUM 116 TaxID=1678002 RepID=UPI0008F5EE49|nr:cell division protein FtsL [Bacillus sp. MUM 116]OIK14040.1 cell division protein FtsL [Bacillus sp. MUM 116]
MSNLARKYQEQQQVSESIQAKPKVIVKKSWLTPGEKVLGIAFAGMVCFGAIHMISNQAQIWQVNKAIQESESTIEMQKKANNDLKVQVSELSTYERIYEKAKEMGLVLNENNVKVVQK